MNLEPRRAFKVVLVGNPQVGKTSIRRRYMGKNFRTDYLRTIGADFASVRVMVKGELILLTIWDIAGQSVFRDFRASFYQGSKSALVVFDVTDPQSLDDTMKWAEEALSFSSGLMTKIYVIANKIDLDEERKVSTEEILEKATELGKKTGLPVTVVPTSALTGENIKEVFDDLCQNLLLLEEADGAAELPAVRFLSGTDSDETKMSLADRVRQLEISVTELQNQMNELRKDNK